MVISTKWFSLKIRSLALAAIGLGPAHRARPPHTRLEDLERRSGQATLAISIGIALEVLGLFISEHPWNFEKFTSLIADLLILIGLLVEYLVIYETIEASRADRIESDKVVASALDRATDAERALLEHKTPRRTVMTDKNKALLADRLAQFRETVFDIGMAGGPGEVMHFCWDLEGALYDAGWHQIDWPSSGFRFARNLRPLAGMIMADNVEIQLDPNDGGANRAPMIALIESLKEIGIEVKETPYNFANENVKAMHILIGPKL
jgi:hypothetical protein